MKIHFKEIRTLSESFTRFDYEKLSKVEVWGNEISIQEFCDLEELTENIGFYKESKKCEICFEVEFNEALQEFQKTYKKIVL